MSTRTANPNLTQKPFRRISTAHDVEMNALVSKRIITFGEPCGSLTFLLCALSPCKHCQEKRMEESIAKLHQKPIKACPHSGVGRRSAAYAQAFGIKSCVATRGGAGDFRKAVGICRKIMHCSKKTKCMISSTEPPPLSKTICSERKTSLRQNGAIIQKRAFSMKCNRHAASRAPSEGRQEKLAKGGTANARRSARSVE